MILEKAVPQELNEICKVYQDAIEAMDAEGNHQWRWGEYPHEAMLREDIALGRLYVAHEQDKVIAAVVVDQTQDEQYAKIPWLFGVRPGCFHRLAIAPSQQGKGLGKKLLAEMEELMKSWGCDCLRCDTRIENARALKLYAGAGMRRVGAVHYPPDEATDYPCLEKPLTEDCPLLPVPMTPAFRGGSLTPWGGKKLREVYGKAWSAAAFPGWKAPTPPGQSCRS